MTTPQSMEERFDTEFGVIKNGIIPFSEQFSADDFKSFIRAEKELSKQRETDRIAREIAKAGENTISLLTNYDTFTGTFWISLNSLYFHLTGRHLNADFEDGTIERNPNIETLLRNADNPQHHD